MTSMNRKPKITIIVAVFNAAETLQRCLDSIVSQKYDDIELVVMDGGSNDGSVEIIKANSDKISYWESKPDRGIYHAWNKALDHVSGDWIYFLGADDYFWNREVLEEISKHLVTPGLDYRIVYGKVALVNRDGQLLSCEGEPWEQIAEKFKQLMVLPHQGVMHHKSLFDDHKRFDESFKIAGDYLFLLQELMHDSALFVPDVIVAGMQQGGVSSDPSASIKLLTELKRAHQIAGLKWEGVHWWFAYLKVRLRQLIWASLGENMARVLLDFLRGCLGKSKYWTRN